MADHKNGGPAFPAEVTEHFYCMGQKSRQVKHPGMALRDYFAAAALGGIEASQGNSGNFISTVEKVAARAYELADAMLAKRDMAATHQAESANPGDEGKK